jgi:hypothetical protein
MEKLDMTPFFGLSEGGISVKRHLNRSKTSLAMVGLSMLDLSDSAHRSWIVGQPEAIQKRASRRSGALGVSANARLLPSRFLAREGFTLVSDRGIVRIEGEHGFFLIV